MGSTEKYTTKTGRTLWMARYRRPDGLQTKKRGFTRKMDAERFIAEVEVSKAHDAYIAPSDAAVTIDQLGQIWLEHHKQVVKPSTFMPDESAWRVHISPKWGTRKVGSIRHSEIKTWVAEKSKTKSPTLVRRIHGVLSAILDDAVKDRRISANPAKNIPLPKKIRKSRAYLTHKQVEQLAKQAAYGDYVRFLAYTGLRRGEASGLRVKDVNPVKRRLRIEENAVVISGVINVGTPKNHEQREVPYPAFLDQAIEAAMQDKTPDQLLWGNGIEHQLTGESKDGWFSGAVKRCQAADPSFPKITPHDLRHTAASLAVSAGANVKALQRMLGHASAAMTLDRYADLFDDDLSDVAEALNTARQDAVGT